MGEAFFTRVEASQKLGRKVRSASNVPFVPEGTEGIVVKVIRFLIYLVQYLLNTMNLRTLVTTYPGMNECDENKELV